MKKHSIKHDLVKSWQKASSEADFLEGAIVERMDYIIHTIFDTFGSRLGSWYFSDAQEGQMGHLTYDEPDLFMQWWQPEIKEDMFIIDKNGEEYMFDQSIPTRWLFEDFENELIDGKKKYEEKESAILVERLSKKEARKKLIASAKKKLTKAELAALKQTL
jgi:hypothetical protein